MRKQEVGFRRELFDEDKRTYPASNADKIYDTVEEVNLSNLFEGETVIVNRETPSYYTKVNGILVERT